VQDRPGLLRAADGGILFLDEIGELGGDEQAMLLRAIEEKRFLPVGTEKEVKSDFQLITGTNCDLTTAVRSGKFREDLLARINLWTFCLPPLRDRREDIEPNLEYELEQFARAHGTKVAFNKEAREQFLKFSISPQAAWSGNFRDLNAAVTRMATFAAGGRITVDIVHDEVERLKQSWGNPKEQPSCEGLTGLLKESVLLEMDLFDQLQLTEVVRVCRSTRSLSDAGRVLFAVSRAKKGKINDADRLRKYLARFGLDWETVQAGGVDAVA
jgi:transcriptional regulatory protein RtcR